MKTVFAAWTWSLAVVARSYWTVLALAAVIALWAWAAYEWLGLPESSGLLLMLALVWAIIQLLALVGIITANVSGAAEVAASGGGKFPLRALWVNGQRKLLNALIFSFGSCCLAWLVATVFDWINNHSVEVASFLTFHSQKPVSHVLIEEIYGVIETLLWIVLAGFFLSFLHTLLHDGWREARKQMWKLLAGCIFHTPFWTSLLSVVVFGGLAYELANWHAKASVGFWDYTQMIARFALVLSLLAAGWLFWLLSLARLYIPKQENS